MITYFSEEFNSIKKYLIFIITYKRVEHNVLSSKYSHNLIPVS